MIESDRKVRMKKNISTHLTMEAKKTLQMVQEEFPDNPKAMEYFYKKLESFYITGSGKLWNDKKVIGTMCIHVPEEIIYAAGAVPVRFCSGVYAADQVGSEFMPAKSCPLIKSTLGMAYLELIPQALLIVNPTTCDQKRKAGEIMREFSDKIYTLELPPTKDTEEARVYWQRVVKKFVRAVENATNQRVTRKRLKEAIKKIKLAQTQFRRFYNLRKNTPPLIYGKDAYLVMNAYFFDDINEWTDALCGLNSELESRKKNNMSIGNERFPRILLTGSPSIFPNLKLPLLIEQLGAVVVADETCSSNRFIYDMVSIDEGFMYDMIPSVADRYLKPSTCPNFTPNSDRDRKLLSMAEEFQIDGIIYQAFAGCYLYEMESRRIGKLMESQGIPMLYLETDYSPDDVGQLSTRIEAFLESLKSRKRRAAN